MLVVRATEPRSVPREPPAARRTDFRGRTCECTRRRTPAGGEAERAPARPAETATPKGTAAPPSFPRATGLRTLFTRPLWEAPALLPDARSPLAEARAPAPGTSA